MNNIKSSMVTIEGVLERIGNAMLQSRIAKEYEDREWWRKSAEEWIEMAIDITRERKT